MRQVRADTSFVLAQIWLLAERKTHRRSASAPGTVPSNSQDHWVPDDQELASRVHQIAAAQGAPCHWDNLHPHLASALGMCRATKNPAKHDQRRNQRASEKHRGVTPLHAPTPLYAGSGGASNLACTFSWCGDFGECIRGRSQMNRKRAAGTVCQVCW